MKARTLVFFGVWGAIVAAGIGCRAIVGIHDLELDDGGSAGSTDGATTNDADSADTGSLPKSDASVCSLAGSKQACRECCRNSNPQGFGGLVRPTGGPPCYCTVCGMTPGNGSCATTACANPPKPNEADSTCLACMEKEALESPLCTTARECKDDGGQDPRCKDYIACADTCK